MRLEKKLTDQKIEQGVRERERETESKTETEKRQKEGRDEGAMGAEGEKMWKK